jgi:hypothetical protein
MDARPAPGAEVTSLALGAVVVEMTCWFQLRYLSYIIL